MKYPYGRQQYHPFSSRIWKLEKAMEFIEFYDARMRPETRVYTWRSYSMTYATWADVSRYTRLVPALRASFLVDLAQGRVYWLDHNTASALDIEMLPLYSGPMTYWPEFS